MAFKKDEEFKFSIRGLDRIVEETGTTFMALRKIAWKYSDEDEVPEDKIKLDLRKYRVDESGNEIMQKGISFATPEGPSELVNILLEEGYGDTSKCLATLSKRGDFREAIEFLNTDDQSVKDELFDIRNIVQWKGYL